MLVGQDIDRSSASGQESASAARLHQNFVLVKDWLIAGDKRGMGLTTAGRAERFAALYAAHYGAVHAYASRRVGSDAADEIAAETFLVAWRRFDELPTEPLPWLYGVARNVMLRHRTKIGRRLQTLEARARADRGPWDRR